MIDFWCENVVFKFFHVMINIKVTMSLKLWKLFLVLVTKLGNKKFFLELSLVEDFMVFVPDFKKWIEKRRVFSKFLCLKVLLRSDHGAHKQYLKAHDDIIMTELLNVGICWTVSQRLKIFRVFLQRWVSCIVFSDFH